MMYQKLVALHAPFGTINLYKLPFKGGQYNQRTEIIDWLKYYSTGAITSTVLSAWLKNTSVSVFKVKKVFFDKSIEIPINEFTRQLVELGLDTRQATIVGMTLHHNPERYLGASKKIHSEINMKALITDCTQNGLISENAQLVRSYIHHLPKQFVTPEGRLRKTFNASGLAQELKQIGMEDENIVLLQQQLSQTYSTDSINKAYQIIKQISTLKWFNSWADVINILTIDPDDVSLIIPLLKNYIAHYYSLNFKPHRTDSVDELPKLYETIQPLFRPENSQEVNTILYAVLETFPTSRIDIPLIRELSMCFHDNRSLLDPVDTRAGSIRHKIHSNITDPAIHKDLQQYINDIDERKLPEDVLINETTPRSQRRVKYELFEAFPDLLAYIQQPDNGVAHILTDRNNSRFILWDEHMTSVDLLQQKLSRENIPDIDDILNIYQQTYHPPISFYDIAKTLDGLLTPVYNKQTWQHLETYARLWIKSHPTHRPAKSLRLIFKRLSKRDYMNAAILISRVKFQLMKYAQSVSDNEALEAFRLCQDLDHIAFTAIFPHLNKKIVDAPIKMGSLRTVLQLLGTVTLMVISSGYQMNRFTINNSFLISGLNQIPLNNIQKIKNAIRNIMDYASDTPQFIRNIFLSDHYDYIDTVEFTVKDFIRSHNSLYMEQLSHLINPVLQYLSILESMVTFNSTKQESSAPSITWLNEREPVPYLDIGKKGEGLFRLNELHIPSPPGFILTRNFWTSSRGYLDRGYFPEHFKDELKSAVKALSRRTGKKFGSNKKPLFLSVRSSPVVSMPGIMHTFLMIGLNDSTLRSLVIQTGRLTAFKYYSKIITSYLKDVMECPQEEIDQAVEDINQEFRDKEKDHNYYGALIHRLKQIRVNGKAYPQDPYIQLYQAVIKVFGSWNSQTAKSFREQFNISDELGSAAIIQQMVLGFMNEHSGSGVITTRDPNTGKKRLQGEFSKSSLGEEVVQGRSYTTKDMQLIDSLLKTEDVYRRLIQYVKRLEVFYKHPLDIEFTIEDGKLFILQVRKAVMADIAWLVSAVDMHRENIITAQQLYQLVPPSRVNRMKFRGLSLTHLRGQKPLVSGIPVGYNTGHGKVAFAMTDVINNSKEGISSVLLQNNMHNDDVTYLPWIKAIVTSHGGQASHPAIIARLSDIACVVNAPLVFEEGQCRLNDDSGRVINKGDYFTVDGTKGNIYKGLIPPISKQDYVKDERYLSQLKKKYYKLIRNVRL